jgi:hypothetical protein
MDPFIEDQEWEDFHSRFNNVVSEELAPAVEPRYIVRVERRIYVEHGLGDDGQVRWADVSVLWSASDAPTAVPSAANANASVAPVECLLPVPQERRETFLVIRERKTMEVVTVIETLSPANKRASSDGREQYLAKREEILASRTNLVELDLLRAGKRLPMVGLPAGDYFAIVSRGHRRPRADVYCWTLRHPLPTIPVPLQAGDAEVSLDLQRAFTTVYDRARYQLSLDYSAPLQAPLSESDQVWLRQLYDEAVRRTSASERQGPPRE